MLQKSELVDLFDRLGTPQSGRNLVMRARIEAPVRKTVSQGGGNVITLFNSRKMGCEIRTESRHIEFPAAVDKEYDAQVLEYYPQPCELKLELIEPATGEIHKIKHTPDFLVITPDGITLEEWKPQERLPRLAEKAPYRYVQDSSGQWSAPLIEDALANMGIRYRLMTDALLPRTRVENYLHLADYFGNAVEPCPLDVFQRIREALAVEGSWSLHDLLNEPHNFSADHLNKAIADRLVVTNLDEEALSEPRRFRLYRDETLRKFMNSGHVISEFPGQSAFVVDIAPGAVFRYESQELTISLVGESEVVFTTSDGSTRTLNNEWLLAAIEEKRVVAVRCPTPQATNFSHYSKEELDTALQRQVWLQGSGRVDKCSERTLRRWRARQVEAASSGANEVLALVPDTRSRGNRVPRLDSDQHAMLEENYTVHWVNNKGKNFTACYRELKVACAQAGITCPSYPTLIKFIKCRKNDGETRAREGKRMAYQTGQFVDRLYVDTPVHGSRPFQYVHIDHTQLDIEVISSKTGKSLGRPWLSFAVDAWSRRIVGMHLDFQPPSSVSVMMVLRDMVKQYGRLPEFLLCDNGPDFRASGLAQFMQRMRGHLRFRPASQPRHGTVMERMFGTVNTQYIHNLAGNTKVTKNVRMTTGKHMPVNFAEWTLENLHYGIRYWATVFYDQEPHPALHCSPREAFQRGLKESGSRPQRQILFNEDFLIATCPVAARGGIRAVNSQSGVKVNDLHYWHPDFSKPSNSRISIQARYDPWDASSIYVYLDKKWVRARCRNLMRLGQFTETERKTLTLEFNANSKTKLDDELSTQRLAEFMRVFTPEGVAEMKLFDQQAEQKTLMSGLGLGSVYAVEPSARSRAFDALGALDAEENDGLVNDRTPPPNTVSNTRPSEDDLPQFDTF
jgi:putative transposase